MGILLDDENEQTLDRLLYIRDRDGKVALRLGLLATLFIEQPWTRAVREVVADAAEEYIRQFGDHLKWTKQTKTARIYPVSAGRVPSPGEWLPNHKDGLAWEFGLHGGEGKLEASDFQVDAYGCDNVRRNSLGDYHVHLPLLWFAEHPGTFPEFVLRLCERIRPLSGYGGIGVLEPLDISSCNKFQPVVRQLAERFPGLEVEGPSTLHVHEGIKGVNWLTILSDRWVEAAGGRDYLRMRLTEDFTFFPYDGGLMIQAGHKPQIGDVKANRWPRHYVTLAKVLKKIQIKDHYPFHFGGPGRLDYEASKAWVFRFDDK